MVSLELHWIKCKVPSWLAVSFSQDILDCRIWKWRDTQAQSRWLLELSLEKTLGLRGEFSVLVCSRIDLDTFSCWSTLSRLDAYALLLTTEPKQSNHSVPNLSSSLGIQESYRNIFSSVSDLFHRILLLLANQKTVHVPCLATNGMKLLLLLLLFWVVGVSRVWNLGNSTGITTSLLWRMEISMVKMKR